MPTKDNTRIIARLRGAPAIAATPETESHPHNPIVRPEDLPADFGRLPPDLRDTRIAELEAALRAAKMHLECSAFNVSSPKAKRQYRDAVDAVDKVLAKPS